MQVRMRALSCLQDSISVNPLNAAVIKRVGGVSMLLQVLDLACGFDSEATSCDDNVSNSSVSSLSTLPMSVMMQSAPLQGLFPALQRTLVERVDSILQYVTTSLTFHDSDIASHYIELLVTVHAPRHSSEEKHGKSAAKLDRPSSWRRFS
jgi:hypothetical protein